MENIEREREAIDFDLHPKGILALKNTYILGKISREKIKLAC